MAEQKELDEKLEDLMKQAENLEKKQIEKETEKAEREGLFSRAGKKAYEAGIKADQAVGRAGDAVRSGASSAREAAGKAAEKTKEKARGASEAIRATPEKLAETAKEIKANTVEKAAGFIDAKTQAFQEIAKEKEEIHDLKVQRDNAQKQMDQCSKEIGSLTKDMLQAGSLGDNAEAKSLEGNIQALVSKMNVLNASKRDLAEKITDRQKLLHEERSSLWNKARSKAQQTAAMARDGLYKGISQAYSAIIRGATREMQMISAGLGKMRDNALDSLQNVRTQGMHAYRVYAENQNITHRASLLAMASKERETAEAVQKQVLSLQEKYTHRAEVRNAGRNFLNVLRGRKPESEIRLTDREQTHLDRLAEQAGNLMRNADSLEKQADQSRQQSIQTISADPDLADDLGLTDETQKNGWVMRNEYGEELRSPDTRDMNELQKKLGMNDRDFEEFLRTEEAVFGGGTAGADEHEAPDLNTDSPSRNEAPAHDEDEFSL